MLAPCEGHEIELTRFSRQPHSSDIRHWTDGLASPWWLEWRLTDRHCITPRPRIVPLNVMASRQHHDRFHLRPEEHLRLEGEGLKPEFKNDPN